MHSKNKARRNPAEQAHVDLVKSLNCVVCGDFGVDAHEPVQGLWWLCIAICPPCHTGPHGIHGDKQRWRFYLKSTDELRALNLTLARVDAMRGRDA